MHGIRGYRKIGRRGISGDHDAACSVHDQGLGRIGIAAGQSGGIEDGRSVRAELHNIGVAGGGGSGDVGSALRVDHDGGCGCGGIGEVRGVEKMAAIGAQLGGKDSRGGAGWDSDAGCGGKPANGNSGNEGVARRIHGEGGGLVRGRASQESAKEQLAIRIYLTDVGIRARLGKRADWERIYVTGTTAPGSLRRTRRNRSGSACEIDISRAIDDGKKAGNGQRLAGDAAGGLGRYGEGNEEEKGKSVSRQATGAAIRPAWRLTAIGFHWRFEIRRGCTGTSGSAESEEDRGHPGAGGLVIQSDAHQGHGLNDAQTIGEAPAQQGAIARRH